MKQLDVYTKLKSFKTFYGSFSKNPSGIIINKMSAICFLFAAFFSGKPLFAVISYTMTASSTSYTPLSGGTNIPDLAAGSDLTVSSPLAIGFSFVFDGVTYTQFQVSDNGYLHFGNDLGSTGYGNAGGDEVIPNDFTDATGSTPGINITRPFVAPLWEELAIANIGGSGSYLVSGSAPNRILTVEWNKVSWRAPTGTDQVSFQVVLHEGSNIIDFIYRADAAALGTLPTASIGLAGITNGDYYSLSDSGPNPTVSKTVNTTTINTKPATGQMYRWTPSVTTGIAAGAVAQSTLKVYEGEQAGMFTVSADLRESGRYALEVIDMAGKLVYRQDLAIEAAGQQDLAISLASCPAGIYLLRLYGSGPAQQAKFIKE